MQAARGTPLNQPDDESVQPAADTVGDTVRDSGEPAEVDGPTAPDGPRPGGARLVVRLSFALAFASFYALDQISKAVVVDRLTGHADVSVVGQLLVLRLTRNPGAAFSTGTSYTVVLSIVAILAVLVVLVLAWRVRSRWWAVALGLLLAGVGGNLTDRIVRPPSPLRGHVIDFLMLPHWPIFNIADICINAAAVMIVIQAIRGVRLDGSRVERDSERTEEEPAETGAGSGETDS